MKDALMWIAGAVLGTIALALFIGTVSILISNVLYNTGVL